jgi:hypothetical protein
MEKVVGGVVMIRRKLAEFRVTIFQGDKDSIVSDISNYYNLERGCNVDIEYNENETLVTIWTSESNSR